MTYNTSDAGANWNTRKPSLQSVISDINPDIIVAIEINNNNTDDFLNNVLGSAYSKGDFTPNNISVSSNSNCLYYKTSKFIDGTFSNTIIPSYLDVAETDPDRDINRFTITENGGNTIVIYSVHLRADGGGGSSTKRAIQISYLTDYISDHAPSTTSENFIVLGDFNIQDPTEGAYQNILVSNGSYFYDPSNPGDISTGTWDQTDFYPYLTWRSLNLTKKFDNILISGNVQDNTYGIQYNSNSYTVYGSPNDYDQEASTLEAREASDHLPVYATFLFTNNSSPVELVSFTGVLNKNHIDLNWRTETEVNNYGFNIERTKEDLNWLAIGFVEGYGNSNSPKNYNFNDFGIKLHGTYYYRLKQIDNDGAFEYSDILTVDTSSPYNFSLNQNYPNPFNPETKIKFTISEPRYTTLTVYDALGKKVTRLVNEEKSPGTYEIKFDTENLPGGIYFYQLTAGSFTETKKMILLK
jgi:endonuclease/exonuclease/phosphatase family metal-dependent hydrolase